MTLNLSDADVLVLRQWLHDYLPELSSRPSIIYNPHRKMCRGANRGSQHA
jgi:hypothetical protein